MGDTYCTTRRVQFRDTDAAGIAHFTAFFAFMEEAEHEFLRSVGTSVVSTNPSGVISWPRVSASCDFTGSVKFEDILSIEVGIARIGQKSVTYDFLFTKEGNEIARGTMTSVCCRIVHDAKPESIAIPASFASLLGPYVAT